MKKNVLKAMSVGLSAVTIASTLSVPVYADEPEVEDKKLPVEELKPLPKPVIPAVSEEKIADQAEDLANHMSEDLNEKDHKKDGGVTDIVDDIGESEVNDPVYDRDENPDLVDHAYEAWQKTYDAAQSSWYLKNHTNELNQADKKINQSVKEEKGAVTIAEDAVKEAETIVKGAEAATDGIVVAAQSDNINNAQIKVNDADETLKQAEEDFETQKGLVENARSAFEIAVEAKKKAENEYNIALTKSKEMAALAKKELDDAEKELNRTKAALDKAESEFADTAAHALLKADQAKNDKRNHDPNKYSSYVKAIIENYIAEEGQTVKVKAIDDGDAKFDVTFTNEDGTKTTVKYGYTVSRDGTVEVFEAEKVYKYGDKTVSETDYKELEEAGKAIKRYKAYRYSNKTHSIYTEYLTEDEFKKEKPKHYEEEIVVLGDSTSESLTLDPSKNGYTKTGSKVLNSFFDQKTGEFIQVIENEFEKTISTTKNGKTISTCGYISPTTKSDENSDIIAEAIAKIKAEAEQQRKDIEKYGYITEYGLGGGTFKINEGVTLANDVEDTVVDVIWTVDGYYVPVYYDKKKDVYSVNEKEFNMRNAKTREDAEKEFFKNKNHKNVIILGVEEKATSGSNKSFKFTYVETFEVSKKIQNDTFEDKEKAVNAVKEDLKKVSSWNGKKAVDIQIGEEDTDKKLLSKLNIESEYEYSFTPSYNVSYTKTAEQKVKITTIADVVKETFKNATSVFKSTAEEYLAIIAEAQAKEDAIKNLNKEVKAAKDAVDKAQCEVETIKWELDTLKAKSPTDPKSVAQLTDLDTRLSNAEEELGKQEKRLTEARSQWTQANAIVLARIAAQNQNQGGEEERNYVYNPNVIPTIASIPAVTLPDAGVPLAAATRRVRRVAGVEEVEATEETVEETTPEETTEVTVTETEENPVVIDDEDVARAGGTQRSFFARTWWAWLLLVIAAIGGAVAYTKKKATDLK